MKMTRKTGQVSAVRYPNCAGVDVAKDLHAVALPADADGNQEVKLFGGYTENLLAIGCVAQGAWHRTGGAGVDRGCTGGCAL